MNLFLTFPFLSSEFCPGPLGALLSLGLCGDHLQHPLLSDHSHGPELDALSLGEAQEKGNFSSSPVPRRSGGGHWGNRREVYLGRWIYPRSFSVLWRKAYYTPPPPRSPPQYTDVVLLPNYHILFMAPSCCDPEQFLRRKESLTLDFSVAHPRL